MLSVLSPRRYLLAAISVAILLGVYLSSHLPATEELYDRYVPSSLGQHGDILDAISNSTLGVSAQGHDDHDQC